MMLDSWIHPSDALICRACGKVWVIHVNHYGVSLLQHDGLRHSLLCNWETMLANSGQSCCVRLTLCNQVCPSTYICDDVKCPTSDRILFCSISQQAATSHQCNGTDSEIRHAASLQSTILMSKDLLQIQYPHPQHNELGGLKCFHDWHTVQTILNLQQTLQHVFDKSHVLLVPFSPDVAAHEISHLQYSFIDRLLSGLGAYVLTCNKPCCPDTSACPAGAQARTTGLH